MSSIEDVINDLEDALELDLDVELRDEINRILELRRKPRPYTNQEST